MRPESEYVEILRLLRSGLNDCAVSRATGVPRGTVRDWRRIGRRERTNRRDTCTVCTGAPLDRQAYAYLLGLYLGDGCLSEHRRRVFRLRISLDARYPRVIAECTQAMAVVGQRTVGHTRAPGCVVVNAYWKHWPCLFPQHGAGRKHERPIHLAAWQREITREYPGPLLRGFIHSDGARFLNIVNGTPYVRYEFSNTSADIQRIFCKACEDYGISWTQPSRKHISVARRPDIARLDLAVGPKT
jgi:hypothetical protein